MIVVCLFAMLNILKQNFRGADVMRLELNSLFKTISRPDYSFFDAIKFDISKRVLTRLHKKHISAGRKQMAVFSFDTIGLDIAYFGIYEKKELDCFFAWLNFLADDFNNTAALDIGANIGNHSLYFSDFFKQVFSFEPSPRTYGLLSFNAALVSNIKTFNYGLSKATCSAELGTESKNIGASKIINSSNKNNDAMLKQTIALKVLDDVNVTDLPIRLIKIDVEGHEHEALSGAKKTIEKHQPIILFEQLKQEFNQGSTPTITLLKSYGYDYFAIAEFGPKPSLYWPKFMRKFIQKVMVAFSGKHSSVRLVSTFEARAYPFVIAIPDWLALKLSLN